MDDTEAEEALLLLGGPNLEWRHDPHPYYVNWADDIIEIWFAEYEKYQIHHHYRVAYKCWLGTSSFTTSDLELAKAACERHHATGKWE